MAVTIETYQIKDILKYSNGAGQDGTLANIKNKGKSLPENGDFKYTSDFWAYSSTLTFTAATNGDKVAVVIERPTRQETAWLAFSYKLISTTKFNVAFTPWENNHAIMVVSEFTDITKVNVLNIGILQLFWQELRV